MSNEVEVEVELEVEWAQTVTEASPDHQKHQMSH
jgi:hypothetical protein